MSPAKPRVASWPYRPRARAVFPAPISKLGRGPIWSILESGHLLLVTRVRALREWEFETCREAGKCVCTDFQCGKFLVQSVRDHAFEDHASEAMEGGRGKADGNRWDPEHMKHPRRRHDKIGEWAQKNAYSYGQAPTPSPSPPS